MNRNRGKTKYSEKSTRRVTPLRQSTGYDLDRIYAHLKRREAGSQRVKAGPLARAKRRARLQHNTLEKEPQRQVRSWLLLLLGGHVGDRAYAQVICSTKDVAVFEELGFGEEQYWRELPEGVSFLVDQEANHGHSSSLGELAERGYVFIAQHDAGGEWKTLSEVDAIVHEARPCLAVNANGFVDKKQLQAGRKYWRAVARAKRKLGFEKT